MTFQARDVAESRYIFDQMAVLGPIMLALTAGTPILQGRLVVRFFLMYHRHGLAGFGGIS